MEHEAAAAAAGGAPPDAAAAAGPAEAPAPERFACVQLRGLPYDATEEEVRLFLEVETIDVLMAKRDGRTTGDAVAVFGDTAAAAAALGKHRSYLGRRYVEVTRAKKLDYYKAIVSEMTDGAGLARIGAGAAAGGGFANGGGGAAAAPAPTTVLRLRGLPFQAGKHDVAAFFADLAITPLAETSIYILTDYGRPTGVALVEFASPQDAAAALAKDKQMMGSRYIEVFPSTRDDLQRNLGRCY